LALTVQGSANRPAAREPSCGYALAVTAL